MKQYLLIILFSIFSFPYVWGEAIGTWKVYPSYSDVSDIVPTGKEVFVLASNNLYSYNVNDGSLRTYSNNDLLNGCNIQNIAWMNVAKKLIITYSDYTIDLLSLNGNVENISSLAENSRQTAGNIQAISQNVTSAVKDLSDNALQVLDFINTTVLSDYDSFVEIGEKYGNTAVIIDNMLSKFNAKADNLNAIMAEMATSVTSISESVKESTVAINTSASNSTEIVGEMQGIGEAMDNNNRVTNQLSDSTKQFVNL